MTDSPGMAERPLLVYQSSIGDQKPITLRTQGHASACPFCDHSQLPAILRQDGDILLVPNKYPVLQGSDPYVLIETSLCDTELSLYADEHLLRVFQMAFDLWRDMLANPAYRSVLFMKNHGPFSGGSLRHPHMQLIGLYHVDAQVHISKADFLGPVIQKEPGVELTISDRPRVGYAEFNVILKDEDAFPAFCRLIQKTVRYVLQHYHEGHVDSYNLFFYALDGLTYCKVMPRLATTPIYIGYTISQVTDNLSSIVEDFRQQNPL